MRVTYHTDFMTAGDLDCPHEIWVTHPTHEVSTCQECGAVKEVIMTARLEKADAELKKLRAVADAARRIVAGVECCKELVLSGRDYDALDEALDATK